MNNKGRILLITTDFPPSIGGGICTHSKFIVESLSKLGWEFIILSEFYIPTLEKDIDNFIVAYPFPLYRLPSSPNIISLIKKIFFCIKLCKIHKPDIIIGTGRHPVWFAAIVSFLCNKPLVSIGHGTEFTQKTSKNDFLINRLTYGHSRVLIAISNFTKEIVLMQKIKPRKIEIIYNSADESFFKKIALPEILNFKNEKGLLGKKIILTVGAISDRKGQRIIIESLPFVKQFFSDILYVAVGLTNKKLELEKLATKLGVIDNVLFPGKVGEQELLLWLNACDIFSLTSVLSGGDYEGYGIAVVEAALCGKTSVVSDSAGLKEAVIDKETGVIVCEGSSSDTANAFISLLNNEEYLRYLSDNAKNFALKNNTWSVKAKEYDKILSALL
jgi:glycosyltransferase involved in cell wall biosynthesis